MAKITVLQDFKQNSHSRCSYSNSSMEMTQNTHYRFKKVRTCIKGIGMGWEKKKFGEEQVVV